MADNTLPERDLSAPSSSSEAVTDDERRKFLRRAAIAGLPVVLATVRGRTVFAAGQTASCPASATTSTCGGV
jgi:hypothetical protein